MTIKELYETRIGRLSETEAKAMLVWFINKWLGTVSCMNCGFREYCGDNSNGGSCRCTVFDEVLKEVQLGKSTMM